VSSMQIDGSTHRKRGWGVWTSAPHTPLHLMSIHDTRKNALAIAEELLRKNWGDYFVVRRIELGRRTILTSWNR
jgi:hypothetical protein